MRFQELSEISGSWIDFIEGKCPGLSVSTIPYGREFMHSHLKLVMQHASRFKKPVQELMNETSLYGTPAGESIRRLRQSGSVAVIANMEAGIFGGALSQFLKCLTAVKVCRELAGQGIDAVPVFWINESGSGLSNTGGPLRILNAGSELRRLRAPAKESVDSCSGPGLPFDQVSGLIDQVEDIGRGSFDPEILEMLKASYVRDATWSSACAGLVSALMDEWGIVAVDSGSADFRSKVYAACRPLLGGISETKNSEERIGGHPEDSDIHAPDAPETPPECFIQSLILPVFARIVDPGELSSYMKAQSGFESTGLVPPISWPASSATVIDARRRKIMEKYAIRLQDLWEGEEAVLRRLNERVISSPIEAKLESFKSEAQQWIAGLNDPGMEGRSFTKMKKQSRERIAYQIDKIIGRVERARLDKQQVMERHIRRACSFLAPDGIRQEDGLAGISFPLRYSRSVLSFLCENLDIMKFEHQLVYLE